MRNIDRLAEDIAEERYRRVRALFMQQNARPPFILWQPRESDLPSPLLGRLLRAWHGWRGDDALPSAERLDLDELGEAVDISMVIDVLEGGTDFVYRHYGQGIARFFGRDMLGRRSSEFANHVGVFFAAMYLAVRRRQEPVYSEHEPPVDVFVSQSNRLILPFVGPEGRIEQFLVGNVPEAMFRTLVDTVTDAVIVMDEDNRIRMLNPGAERMFLALEPDLLRRPIQTLIPSPTFLREAAARGSASMPAREAMGRRADGELFPIEVSIGETRRGRRLVRIAVVRDIAERKAAEEEIRSLAFRDPLTGVANRLVFEERLEQTIVRARRSRTSFALFMIDLDDFKRVNDRHGHPTGDAVLREVASRIGSIVRATDVLARLGGDEFAVLQTDLTAERGARLLASRIIDRLHLPMIHHDREIEIGASIGIAIYPDDAQTDIDLMRRADAALYAAKKIGRNRYVFAGDGGTTQLTAAEV